MIGRYHPEEDELNISSDIADIARYFREAGLDVDVTPTIEREIWAKTIINSAINPLTAITRERNGIIIENPEIRDIAVNIIKEGVHVAREYGIDISEEEVELLADCWLASAVSTISTDRMSAAKRYRPPIAANCSTSGSAPITRTAAATVPTASATSSDSRRRSPWFTTAPTRSTRNGPQTSRRSSRTILSTTTNGYWERCPPSPSRCCQAPLPRGRSAAA